MITLQKDFNGYNIQTKIEDETTNEYVLMEAFHNFLVSCGYDEHLISEAMFSVGDSFMNDEKMEEVLADAYSKRIDQKLKGVQIYDY